MDGIATLFVVRNGAGERLGFMVMAVNQVKAGRVLDVLAASVGPGKWTVELNHALELIAKSQRCGFIRCESQRAMGRLLTRTGSQWSTTSTTFMRQVNG